MGVGGKLYDSQTAEKSSTHFPLNATHFSMGDRRVLTGEVNPDITPPLQC